MKNKKGFTLVELLLIIAIIGVLTAVAVPVFTDYTYKVKEKTCLYNREVILQSYRVEHMLDKSVTLKDILKSHMEDKTLNDYCPSGGVYSVVNGEILCSFHDDYVDDNPPDDSSSTAGSDVSSDASSEDDEPTSTIENLIKDHYLGTWKEIGEMVKDNDKKFQGGRFILDEKTDDYYILDAEGLYNIGNGQTKEKDLTKVKFLVKVNVEKPIIIVKESMNSSYNWKDPLYKGDVCYYNGKFYVFKGSDGTSTTAPPPGSLWIEVK